MGKTGLTEIIGNNKADIACMTETWLSDETTDIDGYTCERRDRVDRRGGGRPYLHPLAFHTTAYLYWNVMR